jgi:hypothetical protein
MFFRKMSKALVSVIGWKICIYTTDVWVYALIAIATIIFFNSICQVLSMQVFLSVLALLVVISCILR